MTTTAELEVRVARLEAAVRELTSRGDVKALATVEAVPLVAAQASDGGGSEAPSWLSLAGVAVLAFGGAYVLRALTESAVLPQAGGVAAGVAYAAVWIAAAHFAARRGLRRNALVHAATAAGIAFPLVWETTRRFHFLTPEAGAAVAAVIGLVLLVLAHRDRHEAIAWLGSAGAIGAALSIASADAVLPPLIAGAVVGAATLHIGMANGWTFVAWPAAALTNALAVMAIGFPLLHGGFRSPGVVSAVLVAFAALWLTPMVVRRWRAAEDPQLFDLCQSAIVVVLGFCGAAAVSTMSATGAATLGAAYLTVALGGHVIAVTRRGAVTAVYRVWIGALSASMTAVALFLLLPSLAAAAVAWAICGAMAIEFGVRRGSTALIIESVAAVSLAAALGGVARTAIVSLFASDAGDLVAPAAAIVIVLIAAAAYVRARQHPIARGALLVIIAAGAFFVLVAAPAQLLRVHDRALLALVKTIAIAAIAAGLGLIAPVSETPGAIALARAALVLGGLKLVLEDVRLGRASVLVAAFAAYGFAMLIVARCAHRHTSPPHEIQVTGSSDTFLDAQPEKNVS